MDGTGFDYSAIYSRKMVKISQKLAKLIKNSQKGQKMVKNDPQNKFWNPEFGYQETQTCQCCTSDFSSDI